MAEEFIYKFQGKKITDKKIPLSILRAITHSLENINSQIYYLEYKKHKKIDFNVEITKGSIDVHLTPIDSDPKGIFVLEKQKGLWTSVESDDYKKEYSSDTKIRRNIKKLFSNTINWADSFQVLSGGKNIISPLEINTQLIERIPIEDEKSYDEHICHLYSLNTKNHKIAINLFDGKKVTANIPVPYENKIKLKIKEYIYVRLTRVVGRVHPTLELFKHIPLKSVPLESIDDNKIKDPIKKLEEIKNLKKNWDGYDADTLNPKLIEQAKDYLALIFLFIKSLNLKEELPFITPNSEGKMQFEWDIGEKHLEIEFDDKGNFSILKEIKEYAKEYEVFNFLDTLELIFWVLT